MLRNKWMWLLWFFMAAGFSGYLGMQLFTAPQKPVFLAGETSHGHHQIELECSVCHATPFAGKDTLQEACVGCHSEELRIAQDSHPKSKFTDPRNADRLEHLDARYCVTCHQEHVRERTGLMAVTLPSDLCFHCHSDIAKERPSHNGMAFDTCASAGCHNFHDNRALYEDFLIANAGGQWLKSGAVIPATNLEAMLAYIGKIPADLPRNVIPDALLDDIAAITAAWEQSSHATGNVGCNDCHGEASAWEERPAWSVCQDCHGVQVDGFLAGKHGMRLAQGLEAMTARKSRATQHSGLSFLPDSLDKQLSCATCHDVHLPDRRRAAVDSCLGCHNDTHSEAFPASPHGQLWQQLAAGEVAENQAVSCASCHLPRQNIEVFGKDHITVQHNQNDTLRPNEKMIRPVCMNCHSLEFSIDALADPALIKNNFTGRPAQHIESIDMSLARIPDDESPVTN